MEVRDMLVLMVIVELLCTLSVPTTTGHKQCTVCFEEQFSNFGFLLEFAVIKGVKTTPLPYTCYDRQVHGSLIGKVPDQL